MKNIISTIAATAVLATLASSAHAATRIVTQGRAGYAIVPVTKAQYPAREARHETTVALVTGKPQQPATRLQTVGRAGYQYIPTRSR